MSNQLPFATPDSKLRSEFTNRDKQRRSKRKQLAAAAIVPPRRNDLLPTLALVDRDPHTLVAPLRNVRGLAPAHVREVANSILSLGFSDPVLIDNNGRVIHGLVRAEAAKLLKLPTIPCVVTSSHNPPECKRLRIALNRLAEKNTWSLDELKVELEELTLEDAPIEILGFEADEIDSILAEVEPQGVEPGPLEPSLSPSTAQLGDIFLLGPHRVICGDARDAYVMHLLMQSDVARFVFTDQPYNVQIAGNVSGSGHREFAMASGEMTDEEFEAFNRAWIGQSSRNLVDGGVLATFIDWRGIASVLSAAGANALSQLNFVVWAKTNGGMGSLYRSQHELLPLFKKGDAAHVNNVELGKKGRSRSNLWTYAGASSLGSDARRGLQDHPTVKPVAMLADAILDLTNRGDIVLDPFLGSGSTLIAAHQSGRVLRGIEIDPQYVDLIVHRFEQVTGSTVVLEETGETFAALTQRRKMPTTESAVPVAADESSVDRDPPTAPVYRKRVRISAPKL